MEQIPVYLVTGFLESGKTSFVKDILTDDGFTMGEKNLLIVCEEGIEEYEYNMLSDSNTVMVTVEDEEDFTKEFLINIVKKHKPDKIILEYNGMWDLQELFNNKLPDELVIAQIITTIDSSTYNVYMSNMGAMIVNQYRQSDLVIFNRCNENTKKLALRASVKTINSQANVIFENENGEIEETAGQMPFDINSDIVEPADYDFGIFFEDLMSNPDKYEGKTVRLRLKAYNPERYPGICCVLGRDAMTCCADDISQLGLIARFKNDVILKHNDWVEITADIHKTMLEQYNQEIPVLYTKDIKKIEKLKEELVYFY